MNEYYAQMCYSIDKQLSRIESVFEFNHSQNERLPNIDIYESVTDFTISNVIGILMNTINMLQLGMYNQYYDRLNSNICNIRNEISQNGLMYFDLFNIEYKYEVKKYVKEFDDIDSLMLKLDKPQMSSCCSPLMDLLEQRERIQAFLDSKIYISALLYPVPEFSTAINLCDDKFRLILPFIESRHIYTQQELAHKYSKNHWWWWNYIHDKGNVIDNNLNPDGHSK